MAAPERSESPSLLDKLDEMVSTPLAEFDAFPKLPSTYKARSESRGFLTIFITFMAFLLVLNDLGEYIWGWPDYEFSVDRDTSSDMNVNVDMVVNMPCQCEYFERPTPSCSYSLTLFSDDIPHGNPIGHGVHCPSLNAAVLWRPLAFHIMSSLLP